jgi:hypothetical protein
MDPRYRAAGVLLAALAVTGGTTGMAASGTGSGGAGAEAAATGAARAGASLGAVTCLGESTELAATFDNRQSGVPAGYRVQVSTLDPKTRTWRPRSFAVRVAPRTAAYWGEFNYRPAGPGVVNHEGIYLTDRRAARVRVTVGSRVLATRSFTANQTWCSGAE